MESSSITVTFLEDGGQPAEHVAQELALFIGGASSSLEIAIYDCGLGAATAKIVHDAIAAAMSRGVAVRLGYYSGGHNLPGVPPPTGSSAGFAQSVGVPTRPITGYRGLMHHKYVVRDAGSPQAAVWTGSTNWTDDAFDREENMILQLPSQELAALYRKDFEELWSAGNIEDSGERDGGTVSLMYQHELASVQVWFSPGGGMEMAHAVADTINGARERIVICSPVLTVGPVLGAVRDVIHRGHVPVRGVYDWTQMKEVLQQWGDEPRASWKIDAFTNITRSAHMAGKHSTPFRPGSVHDYMHMKSIVVDDTVFAGSYNFSHSGEENAENLLRIECAPLADAVAADIDHLIQRYGNT